jgi:hypothetical protein
MRLIAFQVEFSKTKVLRSLRLVIGIALLSLFVFYGAPTHLNQRCSAPYWFTVVWSNTPPPS